ncbi:MAG: hypothetical protein M3M95_02915, partial [Pseudomonadota bacterium]|nr:hypothetical protein [Pseudomonadota bacterium]
MSNPLLAELRDAARRKDLPLLSDLLVRAEAEPALESFDLLVTGIEVKEAGCREAAQRLFNLLLQRDWPYAPGHYELAVLLRFWDRHQEAIHHAKHAVRFAPEDFRYRQLFAHMLHAVGAHPEAEAQLAQQKPRSADEQEQLEVLRDFGAYLHEHPRGRAHQLVQQVRDTYHWIGTEEVAARINAAMDEKRGFSLIRMGDGEGAFTKAGAADEAKYARLYDWMRRDWAAALFGKEFDPEGTGYTALVDTLADVSLRQDVVGVP